MDRLISILTDIETLCSNGVFASAERVQELIRDAREIAENVASGTVSRSGQTLPQAILQISTAQSPCRECQALRQELILIRQDHDAKIQTLRQDHDTKIQTLRQDHDTKIQTLRQDHDSQLQSLRQKMDTIALEQDIAKKSALRRQIAINIEYELKMDCLERASELAQKAFLDSDNNWSENKILATPLPSVMQLLDGPAQTTVLNNWFGAGERGERKRKLFNAAMQRLKAFSTEGAHPTSLNGKEVTLEMALQIVDESVGNQERRPQFTEADVKAIVKEYLRVLNDRRDGSKLLF